MKVEDLMRLWGQHAEVEALRRRRIAPVLREKLGRVLDRRGWPWSRPVSLLIDRCVVDEEGAA